jgi:hypothetical protein
MLTREQFKKYIHFYIKREEEFDKAEAILKNLSSESDFVSIVGLAHPHIETYLELLTDAMELKDKDLLSWWVFETECGRIKSMAKIYKQDKNGKDKVYAKLYTIDALYNYIVKEASNVSESKN